MPLTQVQAANDILVSIRTRPEGRVMPEEAREPATWTLVSIRTRPEGRVMLLLCSAGVTLR